jgi:hypothetical protein
MSSRTLRLLTIFSAACTLLVPLATPSFGLVQIDGPCPLRKLRASGSAVWQLLECHKAAMTLQQPVDPTCVGSALADLENKFQSAEKTKGCAGTLKIGRARRVVRRIARQLANQAGDFGNGHADAGIINAANAYFLSFPNFVRYWRDHDVNELHGLIFDAFDSVGYMPHDLLLSMVRLRGEVLPECGDGARTRSEECDGPDAPTCPGTCQPDCTCGARCGDGVVNRPGEHCDGADDSACPGACTDQCTCPSPTCGNGAVDDGEQCDQATGNCGQPGQPEECKVCLPFGTSKSVLDPTPCCDGTPCEATVNALSCICKPSCGFAGEARPFHDCCGGAQASDFGFCP